jgi:UDP-GlcNAc:undecaprenyl-phosphate GlcNAc-1-phosphate transferase
VGAALASALTLPWWRAWCRRAGLVDEPGRRKIHGQPIPLSGGLAILTGFLIPWLGALAVVQLNLLGTETTEKLSYAFDRRAGQLAALFGGAAGMTLLGWLDDKHELRPALKFAGQLLVAAVVALAGIRITLFVTNPVFSYAVTILWILTVTNAFNFVDNMNGLCAGLSLIASLFIGLAAARQAHYLVAAISFLTAGATFGFLPYNFPRATAFLGDAGSHLLGYLMSVLTILPHFYSEKHPHPMAVLSPLFILALPLADLAWVVVLRWRLRKPFYVGDTNHLSHRLVRGGLSQTVAVCLIWAAAALVGSVVFWL